MRPAMYKRPIPRTLLAYAAALGCGMATAQPEPEAAVAPTSSLSQGEIKAQREFRLLDFNRDGYLSRAEVAILPRLAAAFDEADADHDERVSFEEVRSFAARHRAEREQARAVISTQPSTSVGR